MTKPNPQIGQIIRCKYLWKSEEQRGSVDGEKHRPCATILVPNGQPLKVMICAITHAPPRGDDIGVEIPDDEKIAMGLDGDPQWIIASEANLVDWDHPAIIELDTGGWTYGVVPRVLLDTVRAKFQAAYMERGASDSVSNRLAR